MKHHPHIAADKIRFSSVDARRAREEAARQDAKERAYQRLWIRFKRDLDAERAVLFRGGTEEAERRAA